MDRIINATLYLAIIGCIFGLAYFEIYPEQRMEVSKSLALSGYTDFLGVRYYPAFLGPNDVEIETHQDYTVIKYNKKLNQRGVQCTGSMHPFIGCGNTVLTESLGPQDELHVGDIVVYASNGIEIGHQIVGKNENEDCYYLKGSNLIMQDSECVKRGQILERVVLVLPTNESG